MANYIIGISATTEKPQTLTISEIEGSSTRIITTAEGGTILKTVVREGDTIEWRAEGDISGIGGINPKGENSKFFSSLPHAPFDGVGDYIIWKATVGSLPPGDPICIEEFFIGYEVKNVSGTHRHDYEFTMKAKNHIIKISATKDNPAPLTIEETEGGHTIIKNTNEGDKNFETLVSPGDTVTWDVDPDSDITAIEAISETNVDGNVNVFSVQPNQDPDNPKQWTGTIGDFNPEKVEDKVEEYSIAYRVDGVSHSQDPKLRMKTTS